MFTGKTFDLSFCVEGSAGSGQPAAMGVAAGDAGNGRKARLGGPSANRSEERKR